MAMSPEHRDRFLPCGKDSTAVWDHAAADDLDRHELTCAYCQAVAAECHRLTGVLTTWRTEPAIPPPTLAERVMTVVRAELARRRPLALPSPYGPASLDAAAAASALRFAADQIPGVLLRRCRVRASTPLDPPATASDRNGQRTIVDVEVTAAVVLARPLAVNPPLSATIDDLRQVITAVCDHLLGLEAGGVDVTIVDVVERRRSA